MLITMSSVVPYLGITSGDRFQMRVAPLPLDNALAMIPTAGPVAVLFAGDSQSREQAWRFIEFALSAEGQQVLTQTSGYLAVPRAQSDEAAELSKFVQPSRLTDWSTFPGRNSLKISQLIQDEMQQVATLQKTPQNAMQSMVRGIPPLLKRSA